MRIALCVKYDLFGAIALNRLLPSLEGHEIALFFGKKDRPQESTVPPLVMMRRLERDVPLKSFFPLVEQRPVVPQGAYQTFNELARSYGCPAEILTDLKPDGGGARISSFMPDLILSVRFSLIFPLQLIDKTPLGIINIHPGALPAYGGLFAPFWQMLHSRPTLGCSVHFVDKGVDTGPILSVEPIPNTAGRSMLWHFAKLYDAGIDRALACVRRLDSGGTLDAQPQDPAERAYYRYPTDEAFKAFTRAGLKLVTPHDYLELIGLFVPNAEFKVLAETLDLAAALSDHPDDAQMSVPCGAIA